jgi:DNA-directed RNA polymerase sigma subunit (sigma70/sigma32)
MNWQKETINDLRELNYLQDYVNNYPKLMEALNLELTSIRTASSGSEPVSGGENNRTEEKWLSLMAKKERLARNFGSREEKLDRMKKALDRLTNDERRILDLFYINRPTRGNHVERLTAELNMEKTRIYDLKNYALKKLTLCLYGQVED